VPSPPELPTPVSVSDSEVVFRLASRRYRVRGLAKNLSHEQLRVNILVAEEGGEAYHVDTFDLYSSRQRKAFQQQASSELDVKVQTIKGELGRVLLKLEELREAQIAEALTPKARPEVQLSAAEQSEAMGLLNDPSLLERISEDLGRCGLVGESTNRLVAYLATVSRKLERPLAVLVSTALSFVPPEERVQYSAMTGQSLFYMGETDLQHKVLAIAEEEGAEKAAYALKLLQSEGELSIASTGKDPTTGRLVTQEYHVEGPTAIVMTTTAIDVDEELLNRCIVLTVDEGREQTRAIHERQREEETLDGWRLRRERRRLIALHSNAQRLLEPMAVLNPYAKGLTFPDSCTRTRRDHQKYLGLIRTIALIHQHQRTVRHDTAAGSSLPYIEVTLDDIERANRLANEVLGRTLDELPPQTRRFLELIHGWVLEQCEQLDTRQCAFRFTRRELREAVGWSYAQVRKHLDRLVELEYVLVHRGMRGQRFVYELLWDGKGADGAAFFMGLIDVDTLRAQQSKDEGTSESLTPPEQP